MVYLWRSQTLTHLRIVDPLLIAAHVVATHHVDGTVGAGCVQAQVIGHDLLSLGVGKHLVATQTMAIAYADLLVVLSAHRVQAGFRFRIADLLGRRKHKLMVLLGSL